MDKGAEELMETGYKNMRDVGMSKEEAMRGMQELSFQLLSSHPKPEELALIDRFESEWQAEKTQEPMSPTSATSSTTTPTEPK